MSNEKGISAKDALNNLERELTMKNPTTTRNLFQYCCSFCWRTLPNGSTRFNGFGACPRCYRLAHRFVDALRGHRANYFNNLGVRK
jgi:hypothetical protein